MPPIFATFAQALAASAQNVAGSRAWAHNLPTLSRQPRDPPHHMKNHLQVIAHAALGPFAAFTSSVPSAARFAALVGSLLAAAATAQTPHPAPVATATQQASAQAAARYGVPLGELAANAPERYTVQAGDTLWGVARLYLKSPWQWPTLWGMNQALLPNPHRIYPGQTLRLERGQGVATLQLEAGSSRNTEPPTLRLSPRQRVEAVPDGALPTLRPGAIEPFLAEPLIVDSAAFAQAARIVSAQEGRVLLSRGDRAYARGPVGAPLLDGAQDALFRVFRSATPLKDPDTGQVLGYEAIFAGRARLMGSESTTQVQDAQGTPHDAVVPAPIDILSAKEEIRVGDRLLPEPARVLRSYTPHAAPAELQARIVSVYGSAVENAAQNQVVAINRGTQDGVDAGMVLAIQKNGGLAIDKEDIAQPWLKLPDERIGLLMVFRPFERLSYALVLDITDGVRVGDRLVAPR